MTECDDLFYDGTLVVRQRSVPTYRVKLFEELGRRCERLILISSDKSVEKGVVQAETIDGVEHVVIPMKQFGHGVALVYWQDGLSDAIKTCSPDAIVTPADPRLIDNKMLWKESCSRNIPFIGWGLGTSNFFGHGFNAIRRYRRNLVLRRFDSLIAYSSLAKEQYCDAIGISDKKVFIAHNATADCNSHDHMTKSVPTPDSGFQVVSIGRLLPQKKLRLLLDAAAILKSKSRPIDLLIVGDGECRDELQGRCKQLGLKCDFPGHLEGDGLSEAVRDADLFVLPGLGGLAIQQAMSYGLPVVVAEADGTEVDLVRTNGWRIRPDDADALADVIEEAMDDRESTWSKGQESLRIIREEINIVTMAQKMIRAVVETTRLSNQPD